MNDAISWRSAGIYDTDCDENPVFSIGLWNLKAQAAVNTDIINKYVRPKLPSGSDQLGIANQYEAASNDRQEHCGNRDKFVFEFLDDATDIARENLQYA